MIKKENFLKSSKEILGHCVTLTQRFFHNYIKKEESYFFSSLSSASFNSSLVILV